MARWDKRYSMHTNDPLREPGSLLKEFIHTIPKGAALDIAAGDGRNAIFLAKNGYRVDAVDASEAAIEKGRSSAANEEADVNFIRADLETYRMPVETYDLIVNYNYLQRSIIPGIKTALKRGGVVLFETFTLEQKDLGPPSNPDYLLGPNELLRLFAGLYVFYYREGVFEEGGRRKAVASILAKKV